jgi:DNA-binding Lrp family transcriptional regulator
MVATYVPIQTEVGKAGQVAHATAEIKEVHRVEPVAGPYDVIARAEARGMDNLGRLIVSKLQAGNGVTRTLACTVTHP